MIPRVSALLNLLIPHNIVDPLEVKQSDFGKESLILYLQLRLKDISSSSHVFASQNQQFVYVYMYVVYIYICISISRYIVVQHWLILVLRAKDY